MALHNGILHNMSQLIARHSLMHIRTPRNAADKQENRRKIFRGEVEGRERENMEGS